MLLSCISFRPNLPQVFLVATQEVTFRRFISQFAQSASIVSCCHIYHLFITVVASGAKFSPDLCRFSCGWSTSHLLASEGCQQLPCSRCSPIQSSCSPVHSEAGVTNTGVVCEAEVTIFPHLMQIRDRLLHYQDGLFEKNLWIRDFQ